MNTMKKRWMCLFVENDIGVLARISSLLSGKMYNIDSLTVGPTEDPTVSRMTISLTSNDQIFEQIKKQLMRSVEVIKVVDYTDTHIHMKEILFIKVKHCTKDDIKEIFDISEIFKTKLIDYDGKSVIMQCLQTEARNDALIALMKKRFLNRIELVRGGSVAIEAIAIAER
jgi:acetolactate synthase-1/3 small subunit